MNYDDLSDTDKIEMVKLAIQIYQLSGKKFENLSGTLQLDVFTKNVLKVAREIAINL